MPEMFRILIDILKQCTNCTSMRRNKNCFVCQSRICRFLHPEFSGAFQDIRNVFAVLRTFKFLWLFKENFHFMADDLPLFILKPASFKNSEINFLDSFILNNRNLPVSQHIMCCLFRSCQRTGKTDIKRNIF